MFRYKRVFVTIFVGVLCCAITSAQDNTCQLLIEHVLTAIVENCANTAVNNACYVHPNVTIREQADFTTPAQQIPLDLFNRIEIGNPSLDSMQWGAVKLNLQPTNSTSDNSIQVLLFGSATLESRIISDAVFLQFRTDINPTPCDTTQPVLILYVPVSQRATIWVNGAQLEISGLVTMQWTNENSLAATVHQGEMQIIDSETVQAQETINAVLDNGTVLFWSAPRAINAAETQLGDFAQSAVSGIADDTSTREPIPLSTTTSTVETVAVNNSTSTTCANSPIHIVQRGENLYRIALRYEVTIAAITSANGINDPTQLSVGQQLTIPCGTDSGESSLSPTAQPTCSQSTVHTVQQGENLYRIAQQYGTTVDAIAAANNITDPTRIHAGLQLTIPCAGGQSSTPIATTLNPINPNAPDFCANIIASAPPEGLSPDMVALYNQYCT